MTGPAPDVLRVYRSIRSAHLERFAGTRPAQVLYHKSRYDYEESLADDWAVPPRGASRRGVLGHLLRHRYRVVELNEPNMVKRWRDLALALLVIRLRDLVTRHHTDVVAYCIGLTDPAERLAEQFHVPRVLGRRIAPKIISVLVRGFDRLAFGTSGTRELYTGAVGSAALAGKSALFEALPGPCACLAEHGSDGQRTDTLVFVGQFDPRKGISALMRGWDEVRTRGDGYRLHLIGKGRQLAEVQAWAAERPEVQLDVDPPRTVIHDTLRANSALVLLSARVGSLREQVGLPILEGLGHGCSVITTTETGLAGWLADHGHAVLDPGTPPEQLADAIEATLKQARPAAEVLADLPAADQRLAADDWLLDGDEPDSRRLVVMQSIPPPGPQTNPYVSQLFDSLGEHGAQIAVHHFSWRRALIGRFDVYHAHWPERPIRRHSPLRAAGARALFLAVLLRIRLRRKAIVRTLHNAAPHESGPRTERALLRLVDRWTSLWIRLTDATPLPSSAPAVTIAHGHYRDWYTGYDVPATVSGRVLYFGLVRRYKGVPELLAACAALDDPAVSLRVVGKAKDEALAGVVHAAVEADPRISAVLDYVDEPTLAKEIGEAELVVLPYREMHNSGAALLALSLDRPILVPENDITAALAREVGTGWVQTYAGVLSAGDLTRALLAARPGRSGRPDLSSRDWPQVAREHARAYRLAAADHAAGDGQVDGS